MQKLEIRYGSLVKLDDQSVVKVNSIDNHFNQFDYLNEFKNDPILLSQKSIKEVIRY